MGKQEELEKLDRTIKDNEIRRLTVQTNMELLQREVGVLSEVEAQLEENIRCLKKKNIVAMANEYRKAKEDLAKTKARLISLSNDIENFRKATDQVDQSTAKAKEDIEKIKKNADNNILQFSFKRK